MAATQAFVEAGQALRERLHQRGHDEDLEATPPVYVEQYATDDDPAFYRSEAKRNLIANLEHIRAS